MSTFYQNPTTHTELKNKAVSFADDAFVPRCPLRNGTVLFVDVGTGAPLANELKEKVLATTYRGRRFGAKIHTAFAVDLENAAGIWAPSPTHTDNPDYRAVVALISVPRKRKAVSGRATDTFVNRVAITLIGVAEAMARAAVVKGPSRRATKRAAKVAQVAAQEKLLPVELLEALATGQNYVSKRELPAISGVSARLISNWLPRTLIVATPPPVLNPPRPEHNARLQLGSRALGTAAQLRYNRTTQDTYHFKRRVKVLDFTAALAPRNALKSTRAAPEGLALQQWAEMVGNSLTRFCHWRRRPKWLDPTDGAYEVRKTETVAPPALCLSGPVSTHSPDGGASIRAQLVDPLKATVLMALSAAAEDKCNDASSCGVGTTRFGKLAPIAAVKVTQALTDAELLEAMEKLPHWPKILKAYNADGGAVKCTRNKAWKSAADGAPYKCTGIASGDTIFAPVLGDPKWFRLRQFRDLRSCYDLLVETEEKRGEPFTRVIHSRLEYEWIAPHPPLSLLYPPSSVWIPSGEDFRLGLNDRHAVLSRASAEVYLRRWDFITSEVVLWIDPQLRRRKVDNGAYLVPENFLGRTMVYFQQHVQRFPAAAYLTCSNVTGAPGYREGCTERFFPNLKQIEDRGDPLLWAKTSRSMMGRYASEMEMAIQHAAALTLPGAHYNMPKKDTSCSPRLWHDSRMGGGSCVIVEAPMKLSAPFRTFLKTTQRTAYKEDSIFVHWLREE